MARRDTDDDAPWLASADGGRETTTVSRRSLFWTIVMALVLIAAVVIGGVILLAKKQGGSTAGYMNAEQAPLITAEAGPYKVRPDDPKGLAVDGQGDTRFGAGQGDDQQGQIDTSAAPEEPLERPGAAPVATPGFEGPPHDLLAPATPPVIAPAVVTPHPAPPTAAPPPVATPKPAPIVVAKPIPAKARAREPLVIDIPGEPKPKADAPPKPKPDVATNSGGTVQLGAFSSEDKADEAWAALGGKTGGLTKRIVKVEKDGKTLYRLRASGGDAGALCDQLKADGAACAVVK